MEKPARVAFLFTLLLVVSAMPLAGAEPYKPAPGAVSTTTADQAISSLALDATGRFGLVGVTPNPLPVIPGQIAYDLYAFDMTRGRVWEGHHLPTNRTNQPQIVKAAAPRSPADSALFVVAGPGNLLSLWSTTRGGTPIWEARIGPNHIPGLTAINDVAISQDGRSIYIAAAVGQNGQIVRIVPLTETQEVSIAWRHTMPLSHAQKVELSRDNTMLVAGTVGSVVFIKDPASCARRQNSDEIDITGACKNQFHRETVTGTVTSVAVSKDGRRAVAGTTTTANTGFVYYYNTADFLSSLWPQYADNYNAPVRAVAIAGNGTHFAVGSGLNTDGAVSIYAIVERADLLAARIARFATTGATVDVSMSGNGEYTLAAAGNVVHGLWHNRSTPLWTINLGADGPVRAVRTGESGQTIAIAGDKKFVSYRQVWAAAAQVIDGDRRTANPFQRLQFTLNVTNTGSGVDNYTIDVRRPAGWFGDALPVYSLAPGEGRNIPIVVQPNEQTLPGSYVTEVRVLSKASSLRAVGPTIKLNVTINKVYNITLEAPKRDVSIDRNREVDHAFTIRNTGNAPALVNLSAFQNPSSGPNWNIRFEERQILVPPGGAQSGRVTIQAPADALDGQRNDITVFGSVGGGSAVGQLGIVARVNPTFGAGIDTDPSTLPDDGLLKIGASGIQTFRMKVVNRGNTPDTINLTATIVPASAAPHWNVTLDRTSINLDPGRTSLVTVTVTKLVRDADLAQVSVRAHSVSDPAKTESKSVPIEVVKASGDGSAGSLLAGIPGPSGAMAAFALAGLALLARGLARRSR